MASSSADSTEQTMSQETTTGASPNARFLAGDVPSAGVEVKRAGNATLASILVHVGFVLLALFAIANPPSALSPEPEDRIPNEIVWLDVPGPGGGGGGGGNKMPDPPRKAELKGAEKVTVPVTKPAAPIAKADPPPPVPQIQLPAQQAATGVVELPGIVSNVPTPSVPSQGSGVGGGAGTGTGTGAGSGQGSGLGPGFGGGFGGGAYRPGNGVESPQLLHEEKPAYTAGAMRAKVQGVVEVEAVVLPDGSVGQVQVVRSLDDRFGLDEKAIEAVKRWRFRPGSGTRQGKPVPVLVTIVLTFTLR